MHAYIHLYEVYARLKFKWEIYQMGSFMRGFNLETRLNFTCLFMRFEI